MSRRRRLHDAMLGPRAGRCLSWTPWFFADRLRTARGSARSAAPRNRESRSREKSGVGRGPPSSSYLALTRTAQDVARAARPRTLLFVRIRRNQTLARRAGRFRRDHDLCLSPLRRKLIEPRLQLLINQGALAFAHWIRARHIRRRTGPEAAVLVDIRALRGCRRFELCPQRVEEGIAGRCRVERGRHQEELREGPVCEWRIGQQGGWRHGDGKGHERKENWSDRHHHQRRDGKFASGMRCTRSRLDLGIASRCRAESRALLEKAVFAAGRVGRGLSQLRVAAWPSRPVSQPAVLSLIHQTHAWHA